MTKRSHGDGGIDERGPNTFRLRYRVNGRRFSATFQGTLADARKELRRLIRSGDTGDHIAPDKLALAVWVERWLALIEREPDLAGGRRRGLVNNRTAERYGELLRLHVVPTLGNRPLQQIQATEIDSLYVKLEKHLAARTVHHVHTVLGSCFKAAIRKGILTHSPAARAEAPVASESDRGSVLDEEQLLRLVTGFRGTSLFPIVAMAAFTGMRRNEILGLRWSDLDASTKSISIARTLEETKRFGLSFKEPKTARSKRTIVIDDGLLTMLLLEREKHQRIAAGVPATAVVDLSLIKLPDGALMFPNPPAPGCDLSFTRPRAPRAVTKGFVRKAGSLGFPRLRLHDLRGTHETLLLDAAVPVHVVAARCGHDPAVLLRTYAKRTKKADTSAAAVIGAMSKGALS